MPGYLYGTCERAMGFCEHRCESLMIKRRACVAHLWSAWHHCDAVSAMQLRRLAVAGAGEEAGYAGY